MKKPKSKRAGKPSAPAALTFGPKGGRGRFFQVKSAVTQGEQRLFLDELAPLLGCSLSDVIRDHLIALAIEHKFLPEDYDSGR